MESSCEPNGGSIDSTVGGLVWVRRRNGSWWPGRILSSDELPESCLVSPRSGTPVKLLGREDASVDWYNFEKSKRVKAFRCGEYDECIEKAKITASISSKKTVKYARREDAILHALELETSQELSRTATTPDHSPHNKPEEETEDTSAKSSSLEQQQNTSVSPQELSCTAATPDHSSEDDVTEGSKKRMRGLEDIGIGGVVSSFKRRRTEVAHVHDYLKKKNKRKQLATVLKSTMVTVPVMCEQMTDFKVSVKECNELKRSFCDSNGDDYENYDCSGRLFDVPFIGDDRNTAGSSPVLVSEKNRIGTDGQSGQSSFIETLSVGPEEIQESGSISSGAATADIINDISPKIDSNGTSKWQHKGKRKSRNKNKTVRKFADTNTVTWFSNNPTYQPVDHGYRKPDPGSLYDVDIEVKTGHFPQHVPYISLLSKLTGQPVTGHSLEVEVLNDSGSECVSNNSCELEENPVNLVNGNAEKVPEASRNRVSSNKKIRRLSSLTGSKRPKETEMTKSPVLACVPLKVVFARINAALGINTMQSGAR